MNANISKKNILKMLKVKDISEMFQKSPSWVYKNWEILGGVKFSGSLVFPREEELYSRIFSKMGTIVPSIK